MDLVLRKRLALNIYKRQSITDRIFKRIVRTDCLTQTGVTYEVVSNIPKASEELEDRESLAQIAASGEDNSLCDGETYIGEPTFSTILLREFCISKINVHNKLTCLMFAQKNIHAACPRWKVS